MVWVFEGAHLAKNRVFQMKSGFLFVRSQFFADEHDLTAFKSARHAHMNDHGAADTLRTFTVVTPTVNRTRRFLFSRLALSGAAIFLARSMALCRSGRSLFTPHTKMQRFGPNSVAATRLHLPSMLTISPVSLSPFAEDR